jgi:hypothetical protein
VFTRRILKPRELVEVTVVEGVANGADGDVDIGVVNEPTHFRVDRTTNGNFHAEAMSVEPTALMAFRDVGEPVS